MLLRILGDILVISAGLLAVYGLYLELRNLFRK